MSRKFKGKMKATPAVALPVAEVATQATAAKPCERPVLGRAVIGDARANIGWMRIGGSP